MFYCNYYASIMRRNVITGEDATALSPPEGATIDIYQQSPEGELSSHECFHCNFASVVYHFVFMEVLSLTDNA